MLSPASVSDASRLCWNICSEETSERRKPRRNGEGDDIPGNSDNFLSRSINKKSQKNKKLWDRVFSEEGETEIVLMLKKSENRASV